MKGFPVLFLLFSAVFSHPAVDKDSKIVGGENAVEYNAPFMVTLQVDRTRTGVYRHTCGGSILNPNWVLSAAHCVMGEVFPYQIIAGQHNLAVNSGREQFRRVASFIMHEGFLAGDVVGPFDVAVLRLSSPLIFVPSIVGAVKLPPTGTIPTGNVQLYGWGSTSQTNTPSIPDILQTVAKPIIPQDICREIVNAVMDHEPLHFTNICTGPLDSVITACSGDSGGPIVQVGASGDVS